MSIALEPPIAPASPASAVPDLSRRDYLRGLRRMTLWVVLLGLFARIFRYMLDASIWMDEAALGLNILRRDFEGLTHTLDEWQVAPILFLWAERSVMLVLGTSEWAMRLIPFLFGIGGLLVFWDCARRVVAPTAAALAVGCMAVARWPVTMSGTLKPYTGDLFWSALLMALAVRWRQRPERLWPLIAMVVVVPFALGMSYPTVFVAGAVSVYLLPAIWRHADRRAAGLFAGFDLGFDATAVAQKSFVRSPFSSLHLRRISLSQRVSRILRKGQPDWLTVPIRPPAPLYVLEVRVHGRSRYSHYPEERAHARCRDRRPDQRMREPERTEPRGPSRPRASVDRRDVRW